MTNKYGPQITFTKEIVYKTLKDFVRERHYLPTHQELAAIIGCSYKTVNRRLHELEDDGLLIYDNNSSGRNFKIKSMVVSFEDD